MSGPGEVLAFLKSWEILPQVTSSIALLIGFILFRWSAIFGIRRWKAPSADEKRRWTVQVKNFSLVFVAVGLFAVWATELRAFAILLVAVASAVAISLKEFLLCFLGGLYKASTRPFELRDRIEIGNLRGEVIDHNFLSTTLLEIGPSHDLHQLSGRQIVLPNSMLLTYPVSNQTVQQHYVLQMLRLTVYPGEDWKALETAMLGAANTECASFLEPARRSIMRLQQRESLDLPRVEPRVTFQYGDDGRLHATLRFPTPLDAVSRVEQAILRNVLTARGAVR